MKKGSPAQVFSEELLRNFKNTVFTDHLWTTASANVIPKVWYKEQLR